jgi:hypothetical protein
MLEALVGKGLEAKIALAQAGAGSPRRLDRLTGWLDSVIPNVTLTRALEIARPAETGILGADQSSPSIES